MRQVIVTRVSGIALAGALALGLGLSNPAPAAAAYPADSAVQVAASSSQHPGRPGGVRALTGRALVAALVNQTAEATGQTRAAVVTAVQGGQSLAQVAAAGGSSTDAVVQAVISKLRERTNRAVTNGRLTQAEADAIIAEATTRATDVMNDTTLGERLRSRKNR